MFLNNIITDHKMLKKNTNEKGKMHRDVNERSKRKD